MRPLILLAALSSLLLACNRVAVRWSCRLLPLSRHHLGQPYAYREHGWWPTLMRYRGPVGPGEDTPRICPMTGGRLHDSTYLIAPQAGGGLRGRAQNHAT